MLCDVTDKWESNLNSPRFWRFWSKTSDRLHLSFFIKLIDHFYSRHSMQAKCLDAWEAAKKNSTLFDHHLPEIFEPHSGTDYRTRPNFPNTTQNWYVSTTIHIFTDLVKAQLSPPTRYSLKLQDYNLLSPLLNDRLQEPTPNSQFNRIFSLLWLNFDSSRIFNPHLKPLQTRSISTLMSLKSILDNLARSVHALLQDVKNGF